MCAGIAQAAPDNALNSFKLAQLEFRLNFGVPDAVVLRSLHREGYHDITITKRNLTKARANACKNGLLYDVEIASSGRIRRANEIGKCQRRIDHAEADGILNKRGYREIVLEALPDGSYAGTACLGSKRFRMAINPFGNIQQMEVVGYCQNVFSPDEIAERLRAQGYNRIRFSSDRPPVYSAVACRRLTKVELLLSPRGNIRQEQQIGRCDPPINPARIIDILEAHGFNRVRITDDVLPHYAAEACRNNSRVLIGLNRFGEIRNEQQVGQCLPPLNRKQLLRKLEHEGFKGIRFIDGISNGYLVEACQGNTRFRINFSRYGETEFEREIGPCRSPRIGKIIRDMESNGLSGVKIYAEGCRRGQRVKIELDRFGRTVNARRVGRCR